MPAPTAYEAANDIDAANDISRRQFVSGAVALGALGGLQACGGDGETSSTTTRRVTTPLGTYDIPANPTRVFTVEPRSDIEAALALGLPVVGRAVAEYPLAPWVPVDDTKLARLSGYPPDLEELAGLDVDLIIADNGVESVVVQQMQQIAPVLPDDLRLPWRDMLTMLGEWTGRRERLTALFDQYDAARRDTAAAYADQIASTKLAVVLYAEDTNSFHGAGVDSPMMSLQVLGELGGSVIPFLEERDWEDAVSFEHVGELGEADALLVIYRSLEARQQLEVEPLWQRLPAVSSGKVARAGLEVNHGSVYTATECLAVLAGVYDLI